MDGCLKSLLDKFATPLDRWDKNLQAFQDNLDSMSMAP
jgi:hypothetical protein